jgi:hypothetical protein
VTDRRARYTRLATVALSVCWICVSEATALQVRFDVVATDTVTGVNGLTVYTIRDNSAERCYTLFVVEGDKSATPAGVPPPLVPSMTDDEAERVRTADALRALKAERDRRITQLRARTSTMWTIDYTVERERIEDEYERSVGTLLPDLYPPSQVAPGFRTTSREERDGAVARAIAEGDKVIASIARAPLEERLTMLLERADPARAARVAVSGPAPCPSPAK